MTERVRRLAEVTHAIRVATKPDGSICLDTFEHSLLAGGYSIIGPEERARATDDELLSETDEQTVARLRAAGIDPDEAVTLMRRVTAEALSALAEPQEKR